jgi:hypothetical protein
LAIKNKLPRKEKTMGHVSGKVLAARMLKAEGIE